jgi:hypothetical protein
MTAHFAFALRAIWATGQIWFRIKHERSNLRRALLKVGGVFSIRPFQHLDRHAEMAGGFPAIDAGLQEPRRACVPENVRCNVGAKSCKPYRCAPRAPHFLNPLAVIVDDKSVRGTIEPPPAAEVRENSAAELDRRRALLRLLDRSRSAPLHGPAHQINPRPLRC